MTGESSAALATEPPARSRPLLSVVAPTFNETDNVESLVHEIGSALADIDYEVLIVDDDSPDMTWSHVEQMSLSDRRVRLLRRRAEPGLSASVIDGFHAAQGEIVACIDADLQHDPAILPAMLQALQSGCDMVVGSRYVAGGGIGRWNHFRAAGSWLATSLAQLVLGVELRDPMSGFFMMRHRDFERVRQRLNCGGFKILLEIVAHMHPRQLRELPYTFRPRGAGESKLSNRIIAAYACQLWRLWRERMAAAE